MTPAALLAASALTATAVGQPVPSTFTLSDAVPIAGAGALPAAFAPSFVFPLDSPAQLFPALSEQLEISFLAPPIRFGPSDSILDGTVEVVATSFVHGEFACQGTFQASLDIEAFTEFADALLAGGAPISLSGPCPDPRSALVLSSSFAGSAGTEVVEPLIADLLEIRFPAASANAPALFGFDGSLRRDFRFDLDLDSNGEPDADQIARDPAFFDCDADGVVDNIDTNNRAITFPINALAQEFFEDPLAYRGEPYDFADIDADGNLDFVAVTSLETADTPRSIAVSQNFSSGLFPLFPAPIVENILVPPSSNGPAVADLIAADISGAPETDLLYLSPIPNDLRFAISLVVDPVAGGSPLAQPSPITIAVIDENAVFHRAGRFDLSLDDVDHDGLLDIVPNRGTFDDPLFLRQVPGSDARLYQPVGGRGRIGNVVDSLFARLRADAPKDLIAVEGSFFRILEGREDVSLVPPIAYDEPSINVFIEALSGQIVSITPLEPAHTPGDPLLVAAEVRGPETIAIIELVPSDVPEEPYAASVVATLGNSGAPIDGGSLVVADLDNDGDTDLAFWDRNRRQILWFERLGTPADFDFAERVVARGVQDPGDFSSGRSQSELGAADFDNDGELELTTGSQWFDIRVPQDCNNSGRPDPCDIAEGTSLDLNFNSIPDECEDFVPVCPTDINADGATDLDDLLTVVLNFGTTQPLDGGDVTLDGVVDLDDLLEIVIKFGVACR